MLENIDAEKIISFSGIILIFVWIISETRKDLKESRAREEKSLSMLIDIQKRTLEAIHALKEKIG